MIKSLTIILVLVSSAQAFGCRGDFECSGGANRCVIQHGDIEGVCTSGGNTDWQAKPATRSTAGNSCSSDFSCSNGGKCVKFDAKSLYGACSR